MTDAEASKAGVHNRRLYFREDNGKSNLAPAANAQWYKISGVDLPNGDSVATVDQWHMPKIEDEEIDPNDIAAIQHRCRIENPAKNVQAKDWAGHIVGEILGLNSRANADKAKISDLIHMWLKQGVLSIVMRKNGRSGRDQERLTAGVPHSPHPSVERCG
jgi:hypothetical protein